MGYRGRTRDQILEYRIEELEQELATERDLRKQAEDALKWEPIETAPKDGTRLWLYWPEKHPDDRQDVGWWEKRYTIQRWVDHADTDADPPTHWMWLPEEPK